MLRALSSLVILTFCAAGENATDAFQRGLDAYARKDYAAARDAFGGALEAGPVTAPLLHDLALANYRLDQKARALGFWRRALAIDPNFAPARAGRALLETGPPRRAFEGEGALHEARHALERVPLPLFLWMFALALTVSMCAGLKFATARRAARAEERETPRWPWTLAIAPLLTIALGMVAAVRTYLIDEAFATVVGDHAAARSLPHERAVTLFEIPAGGEILIRRHQDRWAQVQTADGAVGWVDDRDLIGVGG